MNLVGDYNFLFLFVGNYEFIFCFEGMVDMKCLVWLLLQQNVFVDVSMSFDQVEEMIEVIGEVFVIDMVLGEFKVLISNEEIMVFFVGQQYCDLIKFIFGVQYIEDQVCGLSVGGSGQDNVYFFDGVNVGLLFFGVFLVEFVLYDIDQIVIVCGGVDVMQYNCFGGFFIDLVSKFGMNDYKVFISYQVESDGMMVDQDIEIDVCFNQD